MKCATVQQLLPIVLNMTKSSEGEKSKTNPCIPIKKIFLRPHSEICICISIAGWAMWPPLAEKISGREAFLSWAYCPSTLEKNQSSPRSEKKGEILSRKK